MTKRICLSIAGPVRRWHMWVADALCRQRDNDVCLRHHGRGIAMPGALPLMLLLEQTIYGMAKDCALDEVSLKSGPLSKLVRDDAAASTYFDVVVAVGGDLNDLPQADVILQPVFDRQSSELGALCALLDDRELRIGVIERSGAGRSISYLAEMDQPVILSKTLNTACTRVADLVAAMVEDDGYPRLGAEAIEATASDKIVAIESVAVVRHTLASMALRLQRRLSATLRGGERWSIGYRTLVGPETDPVAPAATSSYRLLKDDGRRYFADPFPFVRNGKLYIFCEEFPFATGKGVISVFERGSDGQFGPARPALEARHHLSYPVVFEDDGQVWMIPESGASRTVDLYRCTGFPSKWVHEARLLDGIAASDPTIHRDASGYWLFFTSSDQYGSPSDRLSLYRADTLRGPWHAAGRQPVAINPAGARPAGKLFWHGHNLYRPSQDCSKRYGGAVVLNKITRLTASEFDEHPVGRLAPTGDGAIKGTHTLNRHQNFEAIDVFGCPLREHVQLAFGCSALEPKQLPSPPAAWSASPC